ncbi:hypothetical protein OC835_003514 [Tilletia horrida]|nr:hypothetical protein OC835_003514 [Tilletia horrida]
MTSFSTYASRFLSSAYGPFRTEEEEEAAAAAATATGTGSSRLIGRSAAAAAAAAAARPSAATAASSSRRTNAHIAGVGVGNVTLDADPLFYSALYGYDPLHQHSRPSAAAGIASPQSNNYQQQQQHAFGGDPFGDPYEADEDYHNSSHDTDDDHDPSDSRNLQSVALPRDSHWAGHPIDNRSSILNPTPGSSDSGSRSYRDDDDDDDESDDQYHRERRGHRAAYNPNADEHVDDDDYDDDEYWNSEEEDEMLNQPRAPRTATHSAGARRSSTANEDPLSQSGRIIYVHPEPVSDEGWGPWFTRMARGSYNDKNAAVAFATAATFTLVFAGAVAFGAKPQPAPDSPSTRPSSYYTITRTLPILILLTLLSVVASLANLWILRHVAQRLGSNPATSLSTSRSESEEDGAAKIWVRNALLTIPAVLGLGWVWALAGSFVYDDEQWTGGGWSTTGLRFFSLIPLAMAFLFARAVYKRRSALSRSIAVLELSCSILLAHPYIFLVALAQLGIFLLLTIPFLTIFARLFLVGHFTGEKDTAKVWITSARAAWLAWITFGTWLWTWAVLRGIQRVTIAGVVSHWYFHRAGPEGAGPHAPPSSTAAGAGAAGPSSAHGKAPSGVSGPAVGDDGGAGPTPGPGAWLAEEDRPPASTPLPSSRRAGPHGTDGRLPPSAEDVVRASLARATGPALGTIALAALVLSLLRLATLLAWCARRVSKAIARTAERRLAGVSVGPIALGMDDHAGGAGGRALGMGVGVGRYLASRGVSIWLQPVGHGAAVLAGLTAVAQSVSEYALIYTGVTGEAFWKGARRAGRLVSRHGVKGVMDGLVINLLLDMTTIALSFLAGVAGFLFSAHQLHVPADAPLVGLLCAAVPYWTLRLCADVLRNAADTVYLCWAIDRQLKDEHCTKADEAFQTEEDGALPF